MATKSYVVIFPVLVLSILATAAFGARIPGGYEPIKNPNDPAVVELAKFAVAKYNKVFNRELVLLSVIKGEFKSSETDGRIYGLYIYTTDFAAENLKEKYTTVIHDNPSKNVRQLLAFHWLPIDV